MGAQQIGLSPNNHLIDGLVAVATSVGYPAYMPLGYRLQTYYFFWIFTPISQFLKGYVACKKFGIMEDLPSGVARDWRAWCSKPDYFFDPKFYGKSVPTGNYDRLSFPIAVFAASDDPISNQKSVPRFWGHVKSSLPITFTWYDPAILGQKAIGHFGFFRKENRESIWEDTLDALKRFQIKN